MPNSVLAAEVPEGFDCQVQRQTGNSLSVVPAVGRCVGSAEEQRKLGGRAAS